MKRFLLILLVVGSIFAANQASAQSSLYRLANPSGSFTTGSYPTWNSKLDTVSNTGTDTFKVHLATGWATSYSNTLNSVTFQWDVIAISGTLGGTVKVWASGDNAASYNVLNSYTVTNSSVGAIQPSSYSIAGNPYTDYMVTWAGTGTMQGSWKGYITIR